MKIAAAAIEAMSAVATITADPIAITADRSEITADPLEITAAPGLLRFYAGAQSARGRGGCESHAEALS